MKPITALLLCMGIIIFASYHYSNIPGGSQAHHRDDNMALGNPTNAVADHNHKFNFLMVKGDYTLSYNDSLGCPNWVCWHLNPAWMGQSDRCDCFKPDESLPVGFLEVTKADYNNTGFDRGHVCPSAHRSFNDAENEETFLMTNMLPQSPNLNQQTWRFLEDYCRLQLMQQGDECYNIAGGYGTGGEARTGGIKKSIKNGRINVPAYCWKIVLVLKDGEHDLSRIDTNTRVIAVQMPNRQNVTNKKWHEYRVSVDSLEKLTGYNFLSNVPEHVQNIIEKKVDKGPVN